MSKLHASRPIQGGINFASALEEMPSGAILFDRDGCAVFANASFRALAGSADPIGRTFAGLVDRAAKFGRIAQSDAVRLTDWAANGAFQNCDCETSDGVSLSVRLAELAGGSSLAVFEDVTRHRRAAEIAVRDPLTGLASRTEFHDRLDQALARSERNSDPVAILCLDLDRFKSINDTLGHPMGDALLKAVADRIRGVLRATDIVARLGGDEFAILQPEAKQPEAAESLAARLVDLLGRTYVIKGHMLNIGVSIGIAIAPADAGERDTLIKNADLALYRAKADGRGMFRFFEPAMDVQMQARRSLEIDLRRALAMQEFSLVYQPQVSAVDGGVVGFEALIRWGHPERGAVSPAEFIPLAEEIGLITTIGEWVLRSACREAAGWPSSVSVAVNLSAVQFRGGQLVNTVISALAESGLDPTRLELEITESALLNDTDVVLSTLNQFRDLGIKISMDDFGTGYSSLSYLQKFPFTKIKIDQSFVRQMVEDAGCASIVRAVAALGASLGMRTTAEGVETAEQLAQVQLGGCTEVQGYLTGRPLSAQAASAFLITNPPTQKG